MPATLLATLSAALLTSGCSEQVNEWVGPAPELVFRDDPATETLYPPVREALAGQMDAAFGQPLQSVAWEALSSRMHGAVAEVAQEDEDTPTRLEVDLEYEMAPIEPGQQIVFTLGPNVGAVRQVVDYDAEEEILEIDRPLPEEVDGEMVAIAPGHVMQTARPLYARHCQHCHGVTGDGDGPTGWSMDPKPRDFRQGTFKYTSTRTLYRPARDDIMRTLEKGIPGTYMPSFHASMDESERAMVTEYVVWLSSRGEVERRAVAELGDMFGQEVVADFIDDATDDAIDDLIDEAEENGLELTEQAARAQLDDDAVREAAMADLDEEWTDYREDFAEEFSDWGSSVGSKWELSEKKKSVVSPQAARVAMTDRSVLSGREIYLSNEAKCVSCHGRMGAGNGPQTLAFQRADDGDGYNDLPGLHDDWGHPIAPRNLQTGIYRGGRRPVDLYRRIYNGINGAKMPGFGSTLSDEQIWDVVNYVYAVSENPAINAELDAKIAAKAIAPPEKAAKASGAIEGETVAVR